MSSYQPVINSLNDAKSVCLLSHVRPDGDAYGSILGLGLSLCELGKAVRFFNTDGLASIYSFLPGANFIEKTGPTAPDCGKIVALDTSTRDRLGENFQKWGREVDINIDHHASNTLYGKINLIRPDFSATAMVVLELIEQARWPLTPEIAANLYVGLSTDTGSFCFSNTTAETLRAAARLADAGANPAELARQCYQSSSIPRFELGRLAMKTLKLEHDNQLAHLKLTPEMFQKSGARPEDTEGMIDQLQQLAPVRISAIFEFSEQSLRVSLRSKDKEIDVSAIAAEFGGGGHPQAAGIRIDGPPDLHYKKILNRLRVIF